MESACRCITFHSPPSGLKIIVTLRAKGLSPHPRLPWLSLAHLEARVLAICELRCAALHARSNLLPSVGRSAEGGSERHLVSMRPKALHGLRVAVVELAQR